MKFKLLLLALVFTKPALADHGCCDTPELTITKVLPWFRNFQGVFSDQDVNGLAKHYLKLGNSNLLGGHVIFGGYDYSGNFDDCSVEMQILETTQPGHEQVIVPGLYSSAIVGVGRPNRNPDEVVSNAPSIPNQKTIYKWVDEYGNFVDFSTV